MTVTACGQADIGWDDTCVECGGWLHATQRGGYPAELGLACSEDCAADQSARLDWQEAQDHLRMRDLHCDCPTCVKTGVAP